MRRTLTYANVTATLALVLAMSGGAIAASHYLINSTSQIKPSVLKALKGASGKTGPAGPQGSAGVAGSSGVPGSAGALGKEGKEGAQGASGAQGATGPRGPSAKSFDYRGQWEPGRFYPADETFVNVGKDSLWICEHEGGCTGTESPPQELLHRPQDERQWNLLLE